jgi:hypothetical protein
VGGYPVQSGLPHAGRGRLTLEAGSGRQETAKAATDAAGGIADGKYAVARLALPTAKPAEAAKALEASLGRKDLKRLAVAVNKLLERV